MVIGGGVTIGQITVSPATLAGENITRAVARATPLPGESPHWGAGAFRSLAIAEHPTREAREMARKTFHISDFACRRVPVAPKREMAAVPQRLNRWTPSARAGRSVLEAATVDRGPLDQAILAHAFRGELVPQDPNDEPAAPLLARIQAEAAPPPAKRAGPGRPRRGG